MAHVETRVVIALDTNDLAEAKRLIDLTEDKVEFYKVGSVLFTSTGPAAVEAVRSRDKQVFLDLKFHDIPNTVMGAARAAAAMGVYMFTIHCAGGLEMMRAALAGARAGFAAHAGEARPRVLGVTVLTSQATSEGTAGRVLEYARDAVVAGLDGVVCSPLELGQVREAHGRRLVTVVPGIRLAEEGRDDQARVGTPGRAARDGADFIVVGRSVTGSRDPRGTLMKVLQEIQTAVK